MKRLSLLTALVLTACASAPERASLTVTAGVLTLTNPGPGALLEPVLRLDGPGLILPAPCVPRAPNTYGCVIPNLAEGGIFQIQPIPDAAGHLGQICNASANFYRSGETLFRRLESRCGGQP